MEIEMSETHESPDEDHSPEPTRGDPTALPGAKAAMRGLLNYCPYNLLGMKAVEAIRGEERPQPPYGSNREQQLRANIKLGYGIMLVGLFCPIFWCSYLAGLTGEELKWSAIHSGIVALAGFLLAGYSRVQLGQFRRAVTMAEQSPTSFR